MYQVPGTGTVVARTPTNSTSVELLVFSLYLIDLQRILPHTQKTLHRAYSIGCINPRAVVTYVVHPDGVLDIHGALNVFKYTLVHSWVVHGAL